MTIHDKLNHQISKHITVEIVKLIKHQKLKKKYINHHSNTFQIWFKPMHLWLLLKCCLAYNTRKTDILPAVSHEQNVKTKAVLAWYSVLYRVDATLIKCGKWLIYLYITRNN